MVKLIIISVLGYFVALLINVLLVITYVCILSKNKMTCYTVAMYSLNNCPLNGIYHIFTFENACILISLLIKLTFYLP